MNRTGLTGKLLAVFICLPAVAAWCAAGDDACIQEKIRLQKQEAEQCSGVSYIFNPSACFNTRKALAATSRLCPANPAPTPSAQQADAPAVTLPPQEKLQPPYMTPPGSGEINHDVARLKADVSQLREELGQLREELSSCRCSKR